MLRTIRRIVPRVNSSIPVTVYALPRRTFFFKKKEEEAFDPTKLNLDNMSQEDFMKVKTHIDNMPIESVPEHFRPFFEVIKSGAPPESLIPALGLTPDEANQFRDILSSMKGGGFSAMSGMMKLNTLLSTACDRLKEQKK